MVEVGGRDERGSESEAKDFFLVVPFVPSEWPLVSKDGMLSVADVIDWQVKVSSAAQSMGFLSM